MKPFCYLLLFLFLGARAEAAQLILDGKLQSDLNGGGKKITNIADIKFTDGRSFTNWAATNVAGVSPAELASATNAANLATHLGGTFQPLDSDLTAIAALATTAYGRALLTLASQAELLPGVVTNFFTLPQTNLNIIVGTNNSPTANQLLFLLSTSDDPNRFSVDEDGDVTMDGTLTVSALTSSRFVNVTAGALNTDAQPSSTLRGSLNDETGTGSAVFDINPTFSQGATFTGRSTNAAGVWASGSSSGIYGNPLYLGNQNGAYWVLNGGQFGPQGSIVGTIKPTAAGDSLVIQATTLVVGTNNAIWPTNQFQVATPTKSKALAVDTNGNTFLEGALHGPGTGLVLGNGLGNGSITIDTSDMRPTTDAAMALGRSTHRYSAGHFVTVYGNTVRAGNSTTPGPGLWGTGASDSALRLPLNGRILWTLGANDYDSVSSSTISNLSSGLVVGTNFTARGRLESTNVSGMTNSKAVLVDGGLHLPSALFGGSYPVQNGTNYYGGGLHWWDMGTAFPLPSDGGVSYTPGMTLKYHSDWGGGTTTHANRWGKLTAPNLRLEPGYGWGYGQLMLCNEDAVSAVSVNWTRGPSNVEYNRASTNLWSSPLQFVAQMNDASTNHRSVLPGIQGYAPDWNAPAQTSGARMGELWFHSLAPEAYTNGYLQNGGYAQHHHVTAVMLTNGWLSLGRQLNSLGASYADDTTISIDFAKERFTRHRLASNTTFTVTGLTPESVWHTNLVYHRTLILESGATPKTLTWPADLTWVNEAGNATPPASVAGSNIMEITLRGYFDGLTTNVLASAMSGSNKTLVDADLASFLQRTSITDSNMIDALQYLTTSLKRDGLWQNLHVIYPFVGGSSNANAMNLRSNACNITFSGTLTHHANGVTGDGSSGYGDTGYKFNYAGADTNAMIAVYCRSNAPTASGRFASVTDGTSRMGLLRNSASVGIDGPMNNTAGNAAINTSTDFRGFMALSRTNANDYFSAWRTTVTPASAASVATIGNNLFILARNSPPAGFHSDANLAFACAGKGITSAQYTNLMTIVNRYQTILGRNVP